VCNDDVACAADGYYTAYDDNFCTTGTAVQVNGACTGDVSENLGADGSLKPKLATVIDSTCGGGAPSGAVEGTGPITICCR
jgi:hypothetical protein